VESDSRDTRLLVILPALNEEPSILSTINAIKKVAPQANIVVIDNGSTDRTIQIAESIGVSVFREPQPGKGFAIRKGFLLVDDKYDFVFMVDADDTYGVENLSRALDLIQDYGFDMVVGKRVGKKELGTIRKETYKKGHNIGNIALTAVARLLHKVEIEDSLSGWRVMSRPFVKSFSGGATGFEIEAELNAHAYVLSSAVANIDVTYQGRKFDSHSKLNTYRDGFKILKINLALFRDNRPQYAFALFSLPWLLSSIFLIGRAWVGYINTGLVNQFPSLIAGIGSLTVAGLLLTSGLVLQRIKLTRVALIRFEYQRQ